MKIKYFEDTDALYIDFRQAAVGETKDLDREGNICAITIEHAHERTQIPSLSYEQVPG